jgi:hypothetical protein
MWHSDKSRKKVWMYPPGARETIDGGVSAEEAALFAECHRIKGWAMVGRGDGDATWDEICDAIFEYRRVLCGIPIYANYVEMQGGDGTYPLPKGEIVGYHAQVISGYSPDYLHIKHSWFGFCGQHGKLPYEYYLAARDQCVWMVCIDDAEVLIGHAINTPLTITANVPAQLTVTVFPNLTGTIVGNTPQTIALENGKQYAITATAPGYISHTEKVDENTGTLNFILVPVPVNETFWQKMSRFFRELWDKLRHGV